MAVALRRDSSFISSVLFTIVLAYLVPSSWRAAMVLRDVKTLHELAPELQGYAYTLHLLGLAALTIIAIGLLVTWTGFVQSVRWTWFVMFAIVWLWVFPMTIVPLFQHRLTETFPQWWYMAWGMPGDTRIWAENWAIFTTMLVALFMPVRSFFFKRNAVNLGVTANRQ